MKLRLLSALFFACTALHAQDSEDPWPEAFTKHLKGTIGDKLEIEMQLQAEPRDGQFFLGSRDFRGHYWYAHKRVPIDLFGTEEKYAEVKLEEQVWAGGDVGWEYTGTFTGELNADGTYSGTWSDKDGKRKLPFKLAPYEPKGAVKLTAHAFESSWRERTVEGTSSLEHTALLLQLTDGSPAAEKINQRLLRDVRDFFVAGLAEADDCPPPDATKKAEAEEPVTLSTLSKAMTAERDADLLDNQEKWSFSYTAGVELNEHGILCTSQLLSDYTGGAHPNSVTTFFLFDTKTGDEIPLTALFKPGFLEVLPKLTTEKLRKQEGFNAKDEPGPSIESLNFEEGDAAWFISAAGFVVHFNPYAIASYARGNVQLTIPWTELEPWLAAESPLKRFVTKAK